MINRQTDRCTDLIGQAYSYIPNNNKNRNNIFLSPRVRPSSPKEISVQHPPPSCTWIYCDLPWRCNGSNRIHWHHVLRRRCDDRYGVQWTQILNARTMTSTGISTQHSLPSCKSKYCDLPLCLFSLKSINASREIFMTRWRLLHVHVHGVNSLKKSNSKCYNFCGDSWTVFPFLQANHNI